MTIDEVKELLNNANNAINSLSSSANISSLDNVELLISDFSRNWNGEGAASFSGRMNADFGDIDSILSDCTKEIQSLCSCNLSYTNAFYTENAHE